MNVKGGQTNTSSGHANKSLWSILKIWPSSGGRTGKEKWADDPIGAPCDEDFARMDEGGKKKLSAV